MPERALLHTEYCDDKEDALAHYAGLRCMGVPKDYVRLSTDSDEGKTVIELYGDEPGKAPPNFLPYTEGWEVKVASYNDAVARLGAAFGQLTKLPCQHEIRFSPRQNDYVFSADIASSSDDQLKALNKLLAGLYRETGVKATAIRRAFDNGHALRGHAVSGISYEFPLAPSFLKLAHCNTLGAYGNNTHPRMDGGVVL